MIKAPFNFVPLADTVVFPEWGSQISHDIPFADGISGDIIVDIKAITPIFVRNGHGSDIDKSSVEYQSFSQTPSGQYFIPSTSIKGELRRTIEILSFGKMQRVDNKRYSIRDVNNKQYRDSLPYESVHCGWMTINKDGDVEIADHGIPFRISHKSIDGKLATDFCNMFGEGVKIKDAKRTAEFKYWMSPTEVSDTIYSFSEYKLYPNSATVDKRVGVKFSDDGNIRGKLVFTGQPGNRRERKESVPASGKFFEFVFEEVTNPIIFRFNTESDLFKDFAFIYKDSKDWIYWKNRADRDNRKIPVFFKVENNTIHSIGLSYLYKLPFNKRIKDFLGENHKNETYDFSECLFGETSPDNSLKGRIQISHALCEEKYPFELDRIAPYMGSPKPSYYPIYLEQKGENGFLGERDKFHTMMDNEAKLRGWKIYPTRKYYQTRFVVEDNQLDNTNPAVPLGAGSEFKFHVRFQNLKAIELGALLYAILLKNNCHSLGFGKAFGYGTCKYSISDTIGFSIEDINTYISHFTNYMESKIQDYSKTPQIKEFLLMSNPNQADRLKRPLEYMELEEFVKCKQHNPKKRDAKYGEYLPRYSELLKPIEQKSPGPAKYLAEVTFFSRQVKKAKLIEGKDVSQKLLDMNYNKDKLVNGDKIEVELIKNGKELRFIRKI